MLERIKGSMFTDKHPLYLQLDYEYEVRRQYFSIEYLIEKIFNRQKIDSIIENAKMYFNGNSLGIIRYNNFKGECLCKIAVKTSSDYTIKIRPGLEVCNLIPLSVLFAILIT